MKDLYAKHCLASHGMSHESHVTSAAVADRLAAWNEELTALQPVGRALTWFRPPYGQRTRLQVQTLAKRGIAVMLWNIDSQDWQAPKNVSLVEGPVLTLMVQWRRGVIPVPRRPPGRAQSLAGAPCVGGDVGQVGRLPLVDAGALAP